MAPSSLDASNAQILSLKLSCKTNLCMPFLPRGIQVVSRPKIWKHAGIRMSQSSTEPLIVSHSHSLVIENKPAALSTEEGVQPTNISGPVSQLIPNSKEVEFLLTEICETSIAEFELKLNGFNLRVRRALAGGDDPAPPSPPVYTSVSTDTATEVPPSGDSVSTQSLAISRVGPSEGTLLERAADEGLVIIQSPKVGYFRRSRTVKGKRAPPACKEKQVVKEGQVICYIEQFGNAAPVEADVSGEITRILCEDGEPVGYGDAIIAILPSFPGIKKLQS